MHIRSAIKFLVYHMKKDHNLTYEKMLCSLSVKSTTFSQFGSLRWCRRYIKYYSLQEPFCTPAITFRVQCSFWKKSGNVEWDKNFMYVQYIGMPLRIINVCMCRILGYWAVNFFQMFSTCNSLLSRERDEQFSCNFQKKRFTHAFSAELIVIAL